MRGDPVATATAAAPAKPYIVVLDKSSKAVAKATTNRLAGAEDFTTTHRFGTVVQGFSAKLDAHDVAELRDDPRVAFVTPDRPVKASGLVPIATGDNIPAGVRRVGAAIGTDVREASTGNVAVVDTGVDLTHPDLNAVAGKTCNGTGLPTDGNGHGTHVAGTIAARNDGVGAVGVAPGTKIVAVRVLDAGGSGLTSGVICGIDYVTSTRTDSDPSNDIAVASMSLGGYGQDTPDCGRSVGDAFHIAICNSVAAGVTYVVAAGNSGADEQSFTPAAYPEVLTVTAISDSDGLPGGTGGTLAASATGTTRRRPTATSPRGPRRPRTRSPPPGRASARRTPATGTRRCRARAWPRRTSPAWSRSASARGRRPARVPPHAGRGHGHPAPLGRGRRRGEPGPRLHGRPGQPETRYYGFLGAATFTPSDTPLPPAPSVPPVAPVSKVKPVVSGDRTIGSTLASTVGTWTWTGTQPMTMKTQRQRCNTTAGAGCAAIAGATSAGYAPASADIGKVLRVVVTATNAKAAVSVASATTAAVPAPIVAPASVKAPVLSGTPKIGLALSTTAGKYTVTRADGGLVLRARLTATNSKGSATATSAPSGVVPGAAGTGPPVPTAQPTISGTPAAGSTLTAFAGSWTGAAPLTTTVW